MSDLLSNTIQPHEPDCFPVAHPCAERGQGTGEGMVFPSLPVQGGIANSVAPLWFPALHNMLTLNVICCKASK